MVGFSVLIKVSLKKRCRILALAQENKYGVHRGRPGAKVETQLIARSQIQGLENRIDDLIDFCMVRGFVLYIHCMDGGRNFQPFGELLQEGTIVVANQMNLGKGFFVQQCFDWPDAFRRAFGLKDLFDHLFVGCGQRSVPTPSAQVCVSNPCSEYSSGHYLLNSKTVSGGHISNVNYF